MKMKGTLRRQLILNIFKARSNLFCQTFLQHSLLFVCFVPIQIKGKHQCNSPQTAHRHHTRLGQALFVLELKVSKLFQTKTHPARRFLTNVLCLCRCLRSCPCLFILDMRCIFLRNVEGHILNYMW